VAPANESRSRTSEPPASVTGSLKLTVTAMAPPIPYMPSAVAESSEDIIGTIVSIAMFLLSARFSVAGSVRSALFPAVSVNVPAPTTIVLTLRSALLFPDAIV